MARIPMITFRYGVREAKRGFVLPPGFIMRKDLPKHLAPKPLKADQIAAINFGGCEDYELKKKGRR